MSAQVTLSMEIMHEDLKGDVTERDEINKTWVTHDRADFLTKCAKMWDVFHDQSGQVPDNFCPECFQVGRHKMDCSERIMDDPPMTTVERALDREKPDTP